MADDKKRGGGDAERGASRQGDSAQSDFGYQSVGADEHARRVGEVFRSVADNYDVMNDLMSLGAHRFWKRFAAMHSGLREGDAVLDVAAGSGDMARLLARQVGRGGRVVLSDINAEMLAKGKDNMVDAGLVGNIGYALSDAAQLCFVEPCFDCVCIAFGLRNVTHQQRALGAMYRVLRPGGRLLVLEFSRPRLPLWRQIYDCYSFTVIPVLGRVVAGDEASYRYLVESIRRYPSPQVVQEMMRRAGFDAIRIHRLSGGIVTLHVGFKN